MGSSGSKYESSSSSPSVSISDLSTKFNTPHGSSPVPRAFSFPAPSIHHPPVRKGDTHHLVSLTSTTYGSLLLVDRVSDDLNCQDSANQVKSPPYISIAAEKTVDSGDSLSPDSVINTWELMDGLDDDFEFDSNPGKPDSSKKFKFSSKPIANLELGIHGSGKKLEDSYEFLRLDEVTHEEDWVPLSNTKQPLWKHLSQESFLSDLDPNVVSSYKRALSSKLPGYTTNPKNLSKNSQSFSSSSSNCSFSFRKPDSFPSSPLNSPVLMEKPRLPGSEDKITFYFTSLRGIRKTYEDCCSVRTILRGFRVAVDEKDISMDSNYRKELREGLNRKNSDSGPITLPQVFIRGTYIGGVEEIKQLNDSGELADMLKEFPVCKSMNLCKICGDARFMPCTNCGGSRKVFEEDEEVFKRCSVCNENGLVRCIECCS